MNAQDTTPPQSAFDVFFRTEACQIYSLAVKFSEDREPVSLCNFANLAELQQQYPDMILISEDDANKRVADMELKKELAEQSVIEKASQKIRQETGHNFIQIDAGRS
jgi:hypothetical protein